MKALIDSGVSAAEAARLAASPAMTATAGVDADLAEGFGERLEAAFERFDETDANAILDDAFARFTIEAVVARILLPLMNGIGVRWQSGDVSIAQEHFATGVLRGRMLSLARNWGAGGGRSALLACPPGEHHDLGLVAFGLVLRGRGWRVTYLGTDLPIETLADTATKLSPDAVILASVATEPFAAAARKIASLSRRVPVLLGGAGADEDLAARLGALVLEADPIEAAATLGRD
jgi:methanogenic corrinoid protein MtbC1